MQEKILNDVKESLPSFAGHSFDHVARVWHMALQIADKEGADKTIVSLAALLHDVDDYKLVGIENALKLQNARFIMQKNNVPSFMQDKVCEIVSSMGYSNRLQGVYPLTKEGQIVSDADMLDAMGALAITRTLEYAVSKGERVFDKNLFPSEILTKDDYQKKATGGDTAINHFFDKLLKLKTLLFTQTAQELAKERYQTMVNFLVAFFKENETPEWLDYLDNYIKKNKL